MPLTIRSVELPGRVKIPYVSQGDPAGLPVLLLHGYTDSWRSFEWMLRHLPPSIHAIALSQRGHGDAGQPAEGYGPGDFATDLDAFMSALALDRAILVGHSMGSQVALRFALDHPQRCMGLMLIGGFAGLCRSPAVREFWDAAVSGLSDPVDPVLVRDFQRSTLARPVPEHVLETAVRESLKVPARVWRDALRGQMETDLSPDLGRITVPTLLIWGDQDAILSREEQEALAAAIPQARLQVHPGAGHAPHWEEPARMAAQLVAFAQDLARGGATGMHAAIA